ncbi:hypothetical protein Leryth_007279 [Lithospermum erythrorhizon]|nr:hypothetical protein Leryth_007279 [Lithospermum erythrorhizon]
METRSRKRAEATSSAPSSSNSPPGPTTRAAKRSRRSSIIPTSSISTRSRVTTRSQDSLVSPPAPVMDTQESSGSASRGRRGRNPNKDNSDKGKEKEHDVRVRDRDRDAERGFGLNIDANAAGDDEEDNDSEGGVGILHHNLTSASSALQGLLRKLGAGLDDLLPSSQMGSSSHQNGRLKKILAGLRAEGEEGKQVEALTQLCDMLSIGTEDSLSTFSVDSFVPVLVGLLNYESNPDIMLLAARALTHLVDVLPSSCAAVVHYGAVSCFVARLLTIEYMDLAEQSLQALKKISQEHPTACLRAGAMMAVLSYLDFFSTGVQRVALSTAANMCKKLPSDAADFVMEAVPLLTNLLQYHDAKVLEHACICLTRIAEAFTSSPEKLDELCNHGLVTQAASLISTSSSGGGQSSLSTSTYTGLIRLLSTCASGSHVAAKTLLLLGVSGILKDILSGSGLVPGMSVSAALSRPPEQIFEIMNLANELLPPLPQGIISLPTSNVLVRGSISKKPSSSSSSKQEDSNGNLQEVSAREKLLKEQPELLQHFGTDLLPVLIQIYGSSVSGPVRHKCLSVIGKLIFLAGVLAWKDPQVLIPALQVAEILMEKLPRVFSKMFVREGLVHAVDALVSLESSSSTTLQPSSSEKDNDCLTGSSRSRRYRRRGLTSNSDANPSEDNQSTGPTVGSPPNSLEIPSVNTSIRMAVSARAKAFKDKYFSSDPEAGGAGVTDDLIRVKSLCLQLNAGVDEQKIKSKGKSKSHATRLVEVCASKEENLVEVITEILRELGKGDGVSTFEFIGSGVVDSLLNYFTCGYLSKERLSEATLIKLRHQAIQRFKAFIAVALPSDEGSAAPMSVLVQKLQNALSSLERFPVVLSHASRSSTGNARFSSDLSALSQPIKLRLCRAHGEKSLRDYSSNIVLIDPLASLAAVEDFLFPRVQRSDSHPKDAASAGNPESGAIHTGASGSTPSSLTTPATRRHSTRSRSSVNISDSGKKEASQEKHATSSKGKGKAVLKPNQEEGKIPQTRSAARRRAALDKEAQSKPVSGDSTSEDDDLEISPVEIDDALVIDDDDDDISDDEEDDHDGVLGDDSLPVRMTDQVHDVKLSDSVADGPSTPTSNQDSTYPTGGSSSKVTGSLRDSDSAEHRSGGPFASRGSMSFAAAAMVGLASGNSRGVRARHGRLLFGSNDPQRLVFSAGGKQLNRHLTVYQAIQRQLVLDEDDEEKYGGHDSISNDGSRLWGDIYTITYKRADSRSEGTSGGATNSATTPKSAKAASSSANMGSSLDHVSLLDSILQGELPCDMEKGNPTYNILVLLRVLEGLNQLAPRLRVQAVTDSFSEGKLTSFNELSVTGVKIPTDEFVNGKLTPKLARQIQDALALCSGSLPSWCYQLTKSCPFLFPFETRQQYFHSTAFGLSRALHRLQQQQGADGQGSTNEREVRVGRLQRQKVRVSRNRILDSAIKVMEMYSSQKAVLEVEYFGEVGTGLGPTLEFYTLLSHDLQRTGLGMWRSSSLLDGPMMEVDDQYLNGRTKSISDTISTARKSNLVYAPLGLFPQPWPPTVDAAEGNQFSKTMDYFRLLGRVMAKALQDGRLLDLPISTAFYKLVLGQDLDLHDILLFDAELGMTLQELQALVFRKRYLESLGGHNIDKISELHFRGAPVEDLCLDFTLPGYPEYVLKPGDTNVDIYNLEEYISLVVDATVRNGIGRQIESFRSGFNQVFDISTLQIFSPHELDYLLCGRREMWKAESLVDHIKFDHGYTSKSPAIIFLLEIMGEFTPEQQRAFCQFVTGAPRLPPGGLAVLNPKLTIVRKHSSTGNTVHNGSGFLPIPPRKLCTINYCTRLMKGRDHLICHESMNSDSLDTWNFDFFHKPEIVSKVLVFK